MRLICTLILQFVFLCLCAQNSLPLQNGFIENKGQILNQDYQTNTNVLFMYVGKGIKLQLRKDGYSYELFSAASLPALKKGEKFPDPGDLKKATVISSRVDIDFVNMNSNIEVVGGREQSSFLNYVTCGKEIYGVKSYEKVTYKNVFEHTDIEFILSENKSNPLKYNIILHPGADIHNVKFLCKGANLLRVDENQLKIKTSLGEITENIPFSFYTDQPKQSRLVEFNVSGGIISFSGNYNNRKTLVIDPSSNIIWGTYYGGSAYEYCSAAGIDSQNNVYITGYTQSISNIATNGVYQTTLSGNFDIYLAKFSSNGTFLWGTYFGGSGFETAFGILVEPNGAVYVSGDTSSGSNIASPGAHQTTYGGGIDDAILAKFDATGQRLWSTYYGGDQHDIAFCITRDISGDIIIAGHTESMNGVNAIATPGAFSTAYSFAVDAYVAKFNSSGVRQWGTYFGDTGTEEAWGIGTDPEKNIIITGFTSSIANISTPPCHQAFSGGSNDAFITKFDPTGSFIIWSTYYGGSGLEQGAVIEVNNSGDIFVGGNTGSNSGIATPGAYQTVPGSSEDVFVTRFSSTGVRQWGTYYGGNGSDYINDILLDVNQKILICGQTLSTNSISTAGAYQPSLAPGNAYDAYFAKFTGSGAALKAGSYYGAAGTDYGKGIALDNSGHLYLCGETNSASGITTPGSYMPNPAGSGDAFLVKFCIAPDPLISPAGTPTICINDTYTLSAINGYTSYLWNTGSTLNPISVGPFAPGNYYYTVTVGDVYGCVGTSDSTMIVVNNCITGINKIINTGETKIFPIPAHDFIFIENSLFNQEEIKEIEIYSSLGQLIKETKANRQIDIRNLDPGIYFIKYQEQQNISIAKFIKE